jgi:hypothetical protein
MKKALRNKEPGLRLARVSREVVLHNQIYQVLFEAGEVTREYGSDIACDFTRDIISKLWECFPEGNPAVKVVEDSIERTLMLSPCHITAKTFTLARD